jgi:RND family efflux transporter MFP subunit
MIVVLLNVYLALLFIMVKLKIVRFNLFWKVSPALVFLLLLIGLFIPMGWGAPTGPTIVVRQSVPIVPDVAGEVIDVPVEPNTPIKAGDVLFKIDPVPYRATFDQYSAQLLRDQAVLDKDRANLARYEQLSAQNAIARQQTEDQKYLVNQDEASVKLDQALIEGAKWNLDKTVVRAPADGYVTNLALRKGARAASLPLSPVMAFIDTSDTLIGVEIQQIDARYIAPGQPVELTFKFLPGQIYGGTVEAVLQAISTGQVQASGLAATPKGIQAAPFIVRVALDDKELAKRLPAGSTGEAAIFTDRAKAAHVIRKVLLRQIAITNYVNPL